MDTRVYTTKDYLEGLMKPKKRYYDKGLDQSKPVLAYMLDYTWKCKGFLGFSVTEQDITAIHPTKVDLIIVNYQSVSMY